MTNLFGYLPKRPWRAVPCHSGLLIQWHCGATFQCAGCEGRQADGCTDLFSWKVSILLKEAEQFAIDAVEIMRHSRVMLSNYASISEIAVVKL